MGERLQVLGGSELKKVDPRIGTRVKTDPTGTIPDDENFPPETRCRLVELGPEGTFGRISFIPSGAEGNGKC